MKLEWPLLYILIGSTILCYISPSIANIIYIGAALHSLRGPRQVIEAFSVLFIVLMGNPAIFGGGIKALRWVVILAGFVSVLWNSFQNRVPIRFDLNTLVLFLFMMVMLPVAILTSQIPEVSVFKLLSFFAGVFTIFAAFRQTPEYQSYWVSWFFTWMVFLVASSWLILPLGYGYLRNGVGFQGIANHPQALGAIVGIMGAWFSAHIMFSSGRKSPYILWLLAGCLALIFMSEARIGLVIMGGGFVLAWMISSLSGIYVRIPRFGQQVLGLIAIGMTFLLVLDFDSVISFFQDFVQKRDVSSNLSTAFQNSRGFLIEASMANFREFPAFGIGFGVPTDYHQGFAQLETFMGIPIGASIEKGFFPSALLEETGLFGAGITVLFIAGLLRQIIRSRQFPLLWFFLSALLLNIGEAVFFSIGGLGLFDWLIFGFCYGQSLPSRTPLELIKPVPANPPSFAHPVPS